MTQMGCEPNRVDILHTILGVVFDECYERKVYAHIDGDEIPMISKEDLIKNKKATARPQDLADADQLS